MEYTISGPPEKLADELERHAKALRAGENATFAINANERGGQQLVLSFEVADDEDGGDDILWEAY